MNSVRKLALQNLNNILKQQLRFSNGVNFKLVKTAFFLFLLILSVLNIGRPSVSFAQKQIFDPEYIISDNQLTDYQTMTIEQIKEFLEQAGGTLDKYRAVDIDGKEKSAAEIIYRASQEYRINPQILIVLLQREKSLITKKSPSKDDYNWATGFTCYDSLQPVPRFRGFARQVDRAAWRFRYYLEHPWQFQFRVGVQTKTLVIWKDKTLTGEHGRFVMPKNMATAGLYNYAPHLYDNWLFWQIWQNWFAGQEEKYPEGTLVRIKDEKGVWLIQNDQRRPFYSKTVFLLSYKFKDVTIVGIEDLKNYSVGLPMSFPNYSLVQSPFGIFMLTNDIKRPISEKIFKDIGFHPEEIIQVEEADLAVYQLGKPVLSPYPSGALLQNKETNAVYYVKDDVKYPIIDASILQANFPYSHIIKASSQELANFYIGDQVKFRDGTLVKAVDLPTVYVISQEKRLPIVSAETFEAMGYQWDSIIEVDESILNSYTLEEALNI